MEKCASLFRYGVVWHGFLLLWFVVVIVQRHHRRHRRRRRHHHRFFYVNIFHLHLVNAERSAGIILI